VTRQTARDETDPKRTLDLTGRILSPDATASKGRGESRWAAFGAFGHVPTTAVQVTEKLRPKSSTCLKTFCPSTRARRKALAMDTETLRCYLIFMRAEELDNLTEKELQDKANACFIVAERNSAVQVLHQFPPYQFAPPDDAERTRLLLEAQFYLTAVARKRDERVARRDFWMEVAVIVLIGLEIILSFVFGWYGLKEGDQQAKILQHMDQTTAATVKALSDFQEAQSGSLQAQKGSLAAIYGLNAKLTRETGLLGDTQESLRAQVKLGKQQGDLVAQQLAVQKQQWEKENQRPVILVTTFIEQAPGGLEARRTLVPRSVLSTGHTLISEGPKRDHALNVRHAFNVRNVGDGWLRRPRITAFVGSPAHLECVTYLGLISAVPKIRVNLRTTNLLTWHQLPRAPKDAAITS
jgi:hypothetical protein